jgi:hypothetical protein
MWLGGGRNTLGLNGRQLTVSPSFPGPITPTSVPSRVDIQRGKKFFAGRRTATSRRRQRTASTSITKDIDGEASKRPVFAGLEAGDIRPVPKDGQRGSHPDDGKSCELGKKGGMELLTR